METCKTLERCMNDSMKEMFPNAASHKVAEAHGGVDWSKAKN